MLQNTALLTSTIGMLYDIANNYDEARCYETHLIPSSGAIVEYHCAGKMLEESLGPNSETPCCKLQARSLHTHCQHHPPGIHR